MFRTINPLSGGTHSPSSAGANVTASEPVAAPGQVEPAGDQAERQRVPPHIHALRESLQAPSPRQYTTEFLRMLVTKAVLSDIEKALQKHRKAIDLNALEWNEDRLMHLHALSLACGISRYKPPRDFNLNLISLLLEHGADPNLSCHSVEQKNSFLLCCAVTGDNVEMAELLLEHKADPNLTEDGKKSTRPLQLAEELGNPKMIELLINHGAESGETALFAAVRKGNLAVVKQLLELDVNHIAPDGFTALFHARQAADAGLICLLEENGAQELSSKESSELNTQFQNVLAAFCDAHQYRSSRGFSDHGSLSEIANLLDKNGRYYNVNGSFYSPNFSGTPLLRAADCGSLELTTLLLQHGADPNANRGNYGATPLSIAAIKKGNREITKLLLENGANPNPADDGALLKDAIAEGNQDIVALLRGYLANPQVLSLQAAR